jgi:hypothetical protein
MVFKVDYSERLILRGFHDIVTKCAKSMKLEAVREGLAFARPKLMGLHSYQPAPTPIQDMGKIVDEELIWN